MTKSEYVLETIEVEKLYGRQAAVRGVSLRVPRGSIYGLLGPNGAGKSTLLKMVTGLIRPSGGKVLVFGEAWERRHLQRIGALIESPALYGNLTAYENLLVHAQLRGLSERRIREVLKTVDLEGTGRKLASRFSLGMKQRLGIAIALLGEPELLILDEPTNGLDPVGIREFRDFIRRLQGEGITVVLSSHILPEVGQLVDHIGILSGGELKLQGPVGREDDLERLFLETVGGGARHA